MSADIYPALNGAVNILSRYFFCSWKAIVGGTVFGYNASGIPV